MYFGLYPKNDKLFFHFGRPKIVFMLRNVFDVASSFKGRAEKARKLNMTSGWPQDRGSSAAVDEWNQSIINTLAQLEHHDIHVVIFERLFEGADEFLRLFKYLDLPITETVRSTFANYSAQSGEIERKRGCLLTSLEKLDIMNRAVFDKYSELTRSPRNHPIRCGQIGGSSPVL